MERALAYGGVLFDGKGNVLLRKPRNEYDNYVWIFAKGRSEAGDTPEITAKREVLEETGYNARIAAKIDGSFEGGTTVTEFFLMRPEGQPRGFGRETEEIQWVPPEEAEKLSSAALSLYFAALDRREHWRLKHVY
jgi:8-oxo-dGTP pyrophosphatase MutT (NUDIX family)